MSKLWKCYNCVHPTSGSPGVDFVGPAGKCPACGAEESSGRVAQRSTIHFDPPHPVLKAKGTNRRPCDGKPVAGGMATGEPSAVNCPDCRGSKPFLDAMAQRGGDYETVPEAADFTIPDPNESK